MSLRKLAFILVAFGVVAGIYSCDSDSNSEIYSESIMSSSTQVTAFSLYADDSVLVSLDSVFFSIDLKNAMIFNADSLPYGTRINKLVPRITYSAASVAEIIYPFDDTTDSVVDYLAHSTDSIDFSRGNVRFRIVALDGETERTYRLKVNVHKMKPDSLCWAEMAYSGLPTNLSAPVAQRTLRFAGKAYCLSTSGQEWCMASTAEPADSRSWQMQNVSFGFTPEINTFSATTDALYILADDGTLYTSADGESWTSTSQTWANIIGGYGDTLLGLTKSGNEYRHVTYPASTETAVKSDFPVSGASDPVTFDVQWGNKPQLYILGGRDASGNKVADMWGYDGSSWQKISNKPLPEGMEGVVLFPYHSYITDTSNWSVTGYQVLLALGGLKSDRTVNRDVYISYNMGLTWNKGDELLQLPSDFTSVYNAQALVFESVLTDTAAESAWHSTPMRKLPPYYIFAAGDMRSRAVAPITSWDCPYIYLFGGETGMGGFVAQIRRGVLNRLTFKPLQ